MTASPMMTLDPTPKGVPVLSYNIPEPTSYTGRNIIELSFIPAGKTEKDYFTASSLISVKDTTNKDLRAVLTATTKDSDLTVKITSSFKVSIANSIYANAAMVTGKLKLANDGVTIISDRKLADSFSSLSIDDLVQQLRAGYKLNVYQNMYGELEANYIPIASVNIRPRFLLVETYKLSSFFGNYGAGRTLNTFSLLPSEKTSISIKTYRQDTTTSMQASSILDSFTKESSQDFEKMVAFESATRSDSSVDQRFEYQSEADATASWGWGSSQVSSGIKNGADASRSEFVKNMVNATSKHTSEASSRRDVQVNTSTELQKRSLASNTSSVAAASSTSATQTVQNTASTSSEQLTGTETEILREIANTNTGRTLNFVFRQMNQEFLSLLHLTDIRIAFFNGEAESKMEVTLPELDQLISSYINDPAKYSEVRNAILNQILYLKDNSGNTPVAYDINGNPTNDGFVQKRQYVDLNDQPVAPEYYQFVKNRFSKYTDSMGNDLLVKGIIVSAQKNILRTDGVIVDAILGQGDALDAHAHAIEDENVRTNQVANDLTQMEIEKLKLANSIISSGDATKAKLYDQVYNGVSGT